MLRSAGRKWARTGVQRMGRRIKGAQRQQVAHCHVGPPGEFELRGFIILDLPRSPPPHAQAGRKGLAVVRESSSPGSTKRVLTTSRAIADQKPLLQQRTAQPVEHGRGSNHRQETVRKLVPQAGQPQALRAKANAPKPCKSNERKELGEDRGRRQPASKRAVVGA